MMNESEHPCDTGCQYAKDVGMLEYSCGNGCMYEIHNQIESIMIPANMLVCHFCTKQTNSPESLSTHLTGCVARSLVLSYSDSGFQHVSPRGIRNLRGEVVFATQWQRFLSDMSWEVSDFEYDNRFESMFRYVRCRMTQRHAHLAASFITWLGTNVGGSYLYEAKRKSATSKGLFDRSEIYLSQWTIENFRRANINAGWRMVEYFLYDGIPGGEGKVSPPPVYAADLDVLETLAFWLGSVEGQEFIELCERIIYAREKGLTSHDLKRLGVSELAVSM